SPFEVGRLEARDDPDRSATCDRLRQPIGRAAKRREPLGSQEPRGELRLHGDKRMRIGDLGAVGAERRQLAREELPHVDLEAAVKIVGAKVLWVEVPESIGKTPQA